MKHAFHRFHRFLLNILIVCFGVYRDLLVLFLNYSCYIPIILIIPIPPLYCHYFRLYPHLLFISGVCIYIHECWYRLNGHIFLILLTGCFCSYIKMMIIYRSYPQISSAFQMITSMSVGLALGFGFGSDRLQRFFLGQEISGGFSGMNCRVQWENGL